jgi:prolyl-tRNA editing enzyme YbaK/EbsC (Cys-tRNA(Pro) deacylase)
VETKSKSSVQRVVDELKSLNIGTSVQELPDSTRTAKEAAQAVKSQVDQIVKSLVFRTVHTQAPVLILTSGANQVDEEFVSSLLGEDIQFAPADFVREATGFAIGGVAPFGLKQKILMYIDEDLLNFPLIWAAAGSPHAVFSIKPQDLVRSTGASVIPVHQH